MIPLVASYFTTTSLRSVLLFELTNGVMLDNFIFRKLFKYFSFHLDRENFKYHFKKERISLYCFYGLRHCHYVNIIGNGEKNMPELFVLFLTALR